MTAKALDPLVYPVLAERLRSEETAVGFPEDHLHGDGLGARVIAGVRIRVEVDLLVILVADLVEHLFAGAGPGDRRRRRVRRSRCPGCRGIGSRARRSRRPRSGPGGWPARPARSRLHWPVTKSLTSTASPTAKMSGSLVRIWSSTRMPPRSPISQPGHLRQRGIRAHAEREDHDVGRMDLARTWSATSSEPFAALLECRPRRR